MVTVLLIGIEMAGLFGALLSQGIAIIIIYPVAVWLAKEQGAWDPVHDIIFSIIGLLLGSAALWYNLDVILALKALNI